MPDLRGRRYKARDEASYFICAPADVSRVAKGSSFDRICSCCSRHVAVAPSGQRFLKQRAVEEIVKNLPALPILCAMCYFERAAADDQFVPVAGWDEALRELADAVPNMRRFQN